jgi:thiol-disulfide isomerase/thioredoxin
MRKAAVITWLGIVMLGMALLFWRNEWKFNLPTPVPKQYVAVNAGEKINLSQLVSLNNDKPQFLHFFNPSCPCSRFNMPHFKELVKEYGHAVNFAVVVMSDKNWTEKEIQVKYDLSIPVYFDSTIAARCGVYSTPQAVIINNDQQLHYRGNYNKSRYCTDKKTNYAQMALEALLNKHKIELDVFATKAYGCQLPKCTR